MYRIGIIGTENSHAMAFSKIINLPDPLTGKIAYPDLKVVGVYGPDEDSPQAIKKEANVDFIAKDPDEFFGKVDAMFITCRKGSLHKHYALPFIEKGMPLFIDKPFTSNVTEAEGLIAAAKKSGSKLCGGSGLRLAYDVLLFQYHVRTMRKSGEMISAAVNFAADPASEYDGFFFYSPHLVEIALTMFGPEVKSVITRECNGSRLSVWRYADFDVSLHFTKDNYQSSAVLFTKKGNMFRNIDSSLIYYHEMDEFAAMIRTGEMPAPYESLVTSVRMISAVEESVRTNQEVFI
jgi:predicted dehydrogenase